MAGMVTYLIRTAQPYLRLAADLARLVVCDVGQLQPIYPWERHARAAHGNAKTDHSAPLYLLPQPHGTRRHPDVPGRGCSFWFTGCSGACVSWSRFVALVHQAH